MDQHLVLRRNFLNVKGRLLKKWKKCWVKLQDGVLSYYTDSQENDTLEALQLIDGIKVERADKKDTKEDHALRIVHHTNKNFITLLLAAENEAEIAEWYRDITKAIDIGTPNIFGVDLAVTVRKTNKVVPTVVEKCLAYLRGATEVPGIFRVSGAQSEVMAYKAAFDKGEDPDLTTCPDPNVIANLLKLYLRELPNPLLTAELYQRFIDVNASPADQVVERIRQLVNNLPNCNRTALQLIMQHLAVVGANSAVNKMPPANLAIVFGPTILRPGREERMEDAGNMEIANRLTERLIQNFDAIFLKTAAHAQHVRNLSGNLSGTNLNLSGSMTIGPPPLPEGWAEHFTPEGRPYYYNLETKVTTWERPAPKEEIRRHSVDDTASGGAHPRTLERVDSSFGRRRAPALVSVQPSAPPQLPMPPQLSQPTLQFSQPAPTTQPSPVLFQQPPALMTPATQASQPTSPDVAARAPILKSPALDSNSIRSTPAAAKSLVFTPELAARLQSQRFDDSDLTNFANKPASSLPKNPLPEKMMPLDSASSAAPAAATGAGSAGGAGTTPAAAANASAPVAPVAGASVAASGSALAVAAATGASAPAPVGGYPAPAPGVPVGGDELKNKLSRLKPKTPTASTNSASPSPAPSPSPSPAASPAVTSVPASTTPTPLASPSSSLSPAPAVSIPSPSLSASSNVLPPPINAANLPPPISSLPPPPVGALPPPVIDATPPAAPAAATATNPSLPATTTVPKVPARRELPPRDTSNAKAAAASSPAPANAAPPPTTAISGKKSSSSSALSLAAANAQSAGAAPAAVDEASASSTLDSSAESRIANLESRLAAMEQQQKQTNELLAKVLAVLESNGLSLP